MEEKNKLIVKTVPFMGSELMAARDDKTGKISAGVSYICKGIGLTDAQRDNEVKRIQRDLVLSKGSSNLTLPTNGGPQTVQCLDNEFVPLWLAKISITPAMQKEHPEVADRLVQYQLKAAKVLADAFLRKATVKQNRPSLPSVNHATEILCRQYEKAGIAPSYTALAITQIYRSQGINLPDPPVTSEVPTYDLTAIAKELGVMSQASGGKEPHSGAVGAIVASLNVPGDLIVGVPFSKNGHSDDYIRYKAPVLQQVREWLEDHGYPQIIHGKKDFKVIYRRQEVSA